MFSINNILRDNIKNLTPYSSARDEYQGEASVFLDANENAFGSPLEQQFNRYPDPLQVEVAERLDTLFRLGEYGLAFHLREAAASIIPCNLRLPSPVPPASGVAL